MAVSNSGGSSSSNNNKNNVAIFHPENRGNTIVRNFGNYKPVDMA